MAYSTSTGPRQRRQRPLGPADPRQPDAKRQGLSRAEVDALYRAQNGLCPVCRRRLDPTTMVVDHDHELARTHAHRADVGCRACVRGLTDRRCNSVLGWGFEDPEFFLRAARYLVHRRQG